MPVRPRIPAAALLLPLLAGAPACRSRDERPVTPAPEAPAGRERPTPGPPRRWVTPAVLEGTLDNGLSVSLVQRPGAPAMWLQLIFDGGRATDPPGQPGRASVCAQLVSDGPRDMDRDRFAGRLRTLGTDISVAAETRVHVASLTTLGHRLDEAMSLFSAVLLRPALRAEDLQRVVTRWLSYLERAENEPQVAAQLLMPRVAFGAEDLAGRLPDAEALRRLTASDCQRFASERLTPRNARLVAVGDISLAALLGKLRTHLGAWRGEAPPLPPATSRQATVPRLHLVDFPRATGVLVAGLYRTLPPGQGEGALAAPMVAAALGATLRARLDAFTYEVHTQLDSYGDIDLRSFWFHTDGETAGAALAALATGFQDVRPRPIDDEQERQIRLDLTTPSLRQGVQFDLIRDLDTGGGLLSYFARPLRAGLPASLASQLPELYAAASPTALHRARQELGADRVQYLVLGDRRALLPQLKAFLDRGQGPADVVVLNPLGKVVEQIDRAGDGASRR